MNFSTSFLLSIKAGFLNALVLVEGSHNAQVLKRQAAHQRHLQRYSDVQREAFVFRWSERCIDYEGDEEKEKVQGGDSIDFFVGESFKGVQRTEAVVEIHGGREEDDQHNLVKDPAGVGHPHDHAPRWSLYQYH